LLKYETKYFYLWNAYWFYGKELFDELLGDLHGELNDSDKTFERIPNLYFKRNPLEIVGFSREDIMDDSIMADLTPLDDDAEYYYETLPDDRRLSSKIKHLTKDEFIENLSFFKEAGNTTLIIGALSIKKYKNVDSIVTANVVDADMDYTYLPNRIDLMCDLTNPHFSDWFGDYRFDTIICESIPVYICVNPFFFDTVKKLLKPNGTLYVNTINSLQKTYGVDNEFVRVLMRKHGIKIEDITQEDINDLNSMYKSGSKYRLEKMSKLRISDL
jgi:hypothetical protein